MPSRLPMIAARSLGAMPQFALSALGEKRTLAAMQHSGLPVELIDRRDGYIPEHALAEFVGHLARALGQDGLGLFWAPYLTVADYGKWGSYVLSAPDLRSSLERGANVMPIHSNVDRTYLREQSGMAIYTYDFGLRAHPSYPDLAYSAVSYVLSIPRHYLGATWSPTAIEFDIPKGQGNILADETFGCGTTFGHKRLRIRFPQAVLDTPRPDIHDRQVVTRQDILRDVGDEVPNSFIHSVRLTLFRQLADQNLSADKLALTLGIGIRTLQRKLHGEGTSIRDIMNHVRMERARELLALEDASVTSVATALGYSSPNNFSRAFAAQNDLSPQSYAKLVRKQMR